MQERRRVVLSVVPQTLLDEVNEREAAALMAEARALDAKAHADGCAAVAMIITAANFALMVGWVGRIAGWW